jgi:bifunctional DNA-binding transcriptional regulator/antitoxin component of YhaV-PrlF toxin-antitoxin module
VDIRRELALDEGDVLEAQVEDGKIVLTPKELVDRREAAFKRIEAIAERARARWEAEGKTEEEMERLIEEEVEAVRAERYARENT